MTQQGIDRAPVDTSSKPDVLKRLSYIEGHLNGIRRMVEEDKYCVDVLKQTFAVRRAIEKLEAVILDGHLHGCVVEGIKEGREEEVVGELLELYQLANR
jgi:DNA-binding FrmR family transcriptional regulator